jgi:hypothetical protein
MFCLLGSDTEQHFDVAAQMIDAVCGDLRRAYSPSSAVESTA